MRMLQRLAGLAWLFYPATLFCVFAMLAYGMKLGIPENPTLVMWPVTDTLESVVPAMRMLQGWPALLPIGTELHPARYSIVQAGVLAGWVMIRGDEWNPAFNECSVWLTLVGTVIFCLALVRWGVCRWLATLAGVCLLVSPIVRIITEESRQEPVILLLFSLLFLLWDEKKSWRVALVGFLAGVLFNIRGTYLFLLVLLPLLTVTRKRWWRNTFILAGVSVSAVLLLTTIKWYLTGFWQIDGYGYWQPMFRKVSFDYHEGLFRLCQLWTPHESHFWHGETRSGTRLIGESLLGLGENPVPSLRWYGILNLLGLGIAGWRLAPKGTEHRRFVAVIGLVALTQTFLHICYYMYEIRFLVSAYIAILAFGFMGLWQVITYYRQNLWPKGWRESPLVVPYLTLTIFSLLPMIHLKPTISSEVRKEIQNLHDFRAIVGEIERGDNQPVFVLDAPSMLVVFWLNVSGKNYPVFCAYGYNRAVDPEIFMNLPPVAQPPTGDLSRWVVKSSSLGKKRPWEVSLLDPHGTIQGEQIASIIAEHGKFCLIYNAGRQLDPSKEGERWRGLLDYLTKTYDVEKYQVGDACYWRVTSLSGDYLTMK